LNGREARSRGRMIELSIYILFTKRNILEIIISHLQISEYYVFHFLKVVSRNLRLGLTTSIFYRFKIYIP